MLPPWISGLKRLASRLPITLVGLLTGLVVWLGCWPSGAVAGAVNWQEVPATAEGRQWWDSGSLRATKTGHLSVLSRFQASSSADQDNGSTGQAGTKAKRMADLYVMEIDCDQQLFRDTSINGIPQFKAEWLPAAGDTLIGAVIEGSCATARERGVAL